MADVGSREWWLAKEFPPDSLMHQDIRERLLAKVDIIADATSCWRWTASVSRGPRSLPYGRIAPPRKGGRRTTYAHRLAWEMANGTATPAGLEICHGCPGGADPRCCRPSHLRADTHQSNTQDAVAAGNHVSLRNAGEGNAHHKLNDDAVGEILRLVTSRNQSALARQYGVSSSVIRHIMIGRTWRHVRRPARGA